MRNFHEEIEQLQQYQAFLSQEILHTPQLQHLQVMEFCEELQVTMEELQTANQALVNAGEQIAVERQRYQSLFNFAPDGYLVTDEWGKIREANYAAARMLAVQQDSLPGKPLAVFVAQLERSQFRDHLNQLRHLYSRRPEIQQSHQWTVLLQPRSGDPFYAAVHVVFSRDEAQSSHQGKLPLTFRWLLRDITPQVRAEQELRRALAFESTLRLITDRIRSSLNESQILQTVVRELARVMGLAGCDAGLYDLERRTSTIQYECTISIPPAQGTCVEMERFSAGYYQLLQGQCFQFCTISDEIQPSLRGAIAVLACPILDDQQALGDLWLFRPKGSYFDATEIRLIQQVADQCAIAIRQARLYQATHQQVEAMERLNRLKEDFLNTISHELRTPITNMMMALHMLDRAPNKERRERYMQILRAECDREVGLINNLLDLQRLETSSYKSPLAEAIDLQTWLTRLADPWRLRMQERQQSLELRLPEIPTVTLSDRASVERVLIELLRNAHKYTPAGGRIILAVLDPDELIDLDDPLEVSSAKLPLAQSQFALTFIIANTADIPPDQLPLIFNKFYRIPADYPWYQEGTGIGLTLVKRLVELMEGSIQAESQAGWTTFAVRLSVRPSLRSLHFEVK